MWSPRRACFHYANRTATPTFVGRIYREKAISQADVERFVADLKSDEGLRNELSEHASGIGSVVAFAKDKGYDVNAEEASAYISAQAGRDLRDDELDAVAGGKGTADPTHGHSVQTLANVATSTNAAASVSGGPPTVEAVIGSTGMIVVN